jgi:hypothetical protein
MSASSKWFTDHVDLSWMIDQEEAQRKHHLHVFSSAPSKYPTRPQGRNRAPPTPIRNWSSPIGDSPERWQVRRRYSTDIPVKYESSRHQQSWRYGRIPLPPARNFAPRNPGQASTRNVIIAGRVQLCALWDLYNPSDQGLQTLRSAASQSSKIKKRSGRLLPSTNVQGTCSDGGSGLGRVMH